MKIIIAKTLSILLVIAMLVPMMGIMTSAEEELVNIYQAPSSFSSSSTTFNRYYNYEDYDIKPGDVITIAPVSKSNNINTVIDTYHLKDNRYSALMSYSLKDIYVEDITSGTAIVQFTVPDNTVRFRQVVMKMFSDCTLVTVNRPFSAEEYLEYMEEQGADMSYVTPEKFTGEFENVFPKSGPVFNVKLDTQKKDGKWIVVETESSGYYTSTYIPVKEGDMVCIADSSTSASVYFFDQDKQYLSLASSSNMVPFINDSRLSCFISAVEVPQGIAYMRVAARNSFKSGKVFVTINQPMTSYDEYRTLTTPVVTINGEYTYTGNKIIPEVEVKFGGKVLEKDVDYILNCFDNINAGVARVSVNFKGNYAGLNLVQKYFVISQKAVDDASVNFKLTQSEYTYNGYKKVPGVDLTVDGNSLIEDRDYILKYSDNINAGTATVTATLQGNYSGTVSKTFTIKPQELFLNSSNLILSTSEYTYTGSAITPEVIFEVRGKNLVEGVDYTITCENNVNAGTATVTATLIGNYSGSVSQTFTILPREVILVWENTDMPYNGERQTPKAKLFGVVAGDVCDVTVSGWGKFNGTYTAQVESISNPNYVLTGDTTCRFTIFGEPIVQVFDVACDIYDIIPDSAKQAVADAAVNAATDAVNDLADAACEVATELAEDALEAAEAKATEIEETLENTYEQVSDFFTGLFGSFSFLGW